MLILLLFLALAYGTKNMFKQVKGLVKSRVIEDLCTTLDLLVETVALCRICVYRR